MHLGVVASASVKAMPPAANRGEITESSSSGGSIIQSKTTKFGQVNCFEKCHPARSKSQWKTLWRMLRI